MRLSPLAATIVLVLPALVVLAPAHASGGALVDAGHSRVVMAGEAFLLEGHLEGFTGDATVAWSASAGCSVAEPASVLTAAVCTQPGTGEFVLSASDAEDSASDAVRMRVVSESTSSLGTWEGSTLVGATTPIGTRATYPFYNHNFRVPAAASRLVATLHYNTAGAHGDNDYDMEVSGPSGAYLGSSTKNPEVVTVPTPKEGPWVAQVRPFRVTNGSYVLDVQVTVVEGSTAIPALDAASVEGVVGAPVTVSVSATGGVAPYTVAWELSPASRAYDDGTGSAFTFTFVAPTLARAKVTDAEGFESIIGVQVREKGEVTLTARTLTVIGVLDSGFTPYHYDFVGSQHPWNLDADPSNDIDFHADPASYLAGHPGATPIHVTLPTSPAQEVESRRYGMDAAAWDGFRSSSLTSGVHVHYFPGTKIVGALTFGSEWYDGNSAHGTRSAASAGGNLHGSCAECVFVLISSSSDSAMRWVAAQPWIDVVTNSYGAGGPVQTYTLGATRDNMYWNAPVDDTRVAVESGQVIVFSGGNGFVNAFDVPMLTYWSSQKGPDWMVTVGAATPSTEQTYSGAGKPVDITSIGSSYPSSGGTTAKGTGTHSGTSNAAPVTAGYFAKVIQIARERLGDVTPGHADGIVASGTPVACGTAVPACALGDGMLTRDELEDIVYHNTLPSPTRAVIGTVWPSTPLAYYYQGHGVLSGRSLGDTHFHDELAQMVGNMVGDRASLPRPAGERNWMVVDSYCRQHIWGAWTGGYYTGTMPELDAVADPLALAWAKACDTMPAKPFS